MCMRSGRKITGENAAVKSSSGSGMVFSGHGSFSGCGCGYGSIYDD